MWVSLLITLTSELALMLDALTFCSPFALRLKITGPSEYNLNLLVLN